MEGGNDGAGEDRAAWPTSSSSAGAVVAIGGTLDLNMRRARRADIAIIWQATLGTVWEDIPAEERLRLERGAWEAHFRKKIEPFVDGNRTEKWVALGPQGEMFGYLILGETGFLTPEVHAFIYDIWVAPAYRGKGIGKALMEWAESWARKRGHRKIKLEVAETNARARHLYESLGFHAERRYMGKPLD